MIPLLQSRELTLAGGGAYRDPFFTDTQERK
jgi:hypothetical protein